MPRARQTHSSSNGIDSDRLQSLDERYMRLQGEMNALKDGMKDILLEMKSVGLNTQLYKKAAKIREVGIDVHEQEEDELVLYLHALGIIKKAEFEPAY